MSILIATDFSENSRSAARYAAALAATLNAPLRLMHVVDFSGDDNAWRVLYETTDEIEKHARSEATTRLESWFAELDLSDAPEITTSVRFGTPAEGILAESKAERPDVIVTGTVGESRLQHLFFGRTANHLVRETDVPVLAVPPSLEFDGFKRILVAVDFSECSKRALQMAGAWARNFGARIEVIHSVDYDSEVSGLGHMFGDISPRVEELLDERTTSLREFIDAEGLGDLCEEIRVLGTRADHAIVDRAAEGFDLIVMGTHGRRGFARWFLGSTAERVLRSTKLPVLVVSHA